MTGFTSMPKFAVVMAAFNGMHYIATQISSILSQEGVEVDIFISVDLSTDGTEHFLMNLADAEPRINLLSFGQQFGGAGPNFYRLISEVDFSKFDYVSFSDQDDIWFPNKLARAHSMMLKNNAMGYSSGFIAFWPSGRNLVVNKAQPQRDFDYFFESAGPGCTYVIKLALAQSIQGFIKMADSSLYQIEFHDWLIYAYARYRKFLWVIDPIPSMQYRQHYSNQLGVNSGFRSFMLRATKVLSGYGFSQSLLIANLIGANATPIVKKGLMNGVLGYLYLSFKYKSCRRGHAHQIIFFISCVLMAFIHPIRLVINKLCAY